MEALPCCEPHRCRAHQRNIETAHPPRPGMRRGASCAGCGSIARIHSASVSAAACSASLAADPTAASSLSSAGASAPVPACRRRPAAALHRVVAASALKPRPAAAAPAVAGRLQAAGPCRQLRLVADGDLASATGCCSLRCGTAAERQCSHRHGLPSCEIKGTLLSSICDASIRARPSRRADMLGNSSAWTGCARAVRQSGGQ